jgi:hypothetical protein
VVLKGNGTGGLTNATAGTDYIVPGGALGTPSSGNLANCTLPANVATTGANTFAGDQTIGNNNLKTIKTATFNGEIAPSATTGAITINWTQGQNCAFAPSGNVTSMAFTAPPGPCHLQVKIVTGTVRTIAWPASNFYWLNNSAPTLVANKTTFVNLWYDGVNYWAMWGTQV